MKIFHDLSNKTGFAAMEKESYLYKNLLLPYRFSVIKKIDCRRPIILFWRLNKTKKYFFK
jgi:hypothetical protein